MPRSRSRNLTRAEAKCTWVGVGSSVRGARLTDETERAASREQERKIPSRAASAWVRMPSSLPLTSLALNHALLRWGLFDSAMAKVGFYFKSFVYANGTIDMGHWKDKWADLGDGQYVSAEMVFRPE
mgnify:CR=1 FL=1